MTLILKLDLDVIKRYLHIKNEVYVKQFKSYSLNRWTHRQTHRQTQPKTLPSHICGW